MNIKSSVIGVEQDKAEPIHTCKNVAVKFVYDNKSQRRLDDAPTSHKKQCNQRKPDD